MNDLRSRTGLLLVGFNRPELIEARIRELTAMKALNVTISIDGGIGSKQSEISQIVEKYYRSIQDGPILKVIYRDSNLGLAKHVTLAVSESLEKYDRVIVVEDDIVLSPNFYLNMLQAFHIQRENQFQGIVGGFSPLRPLRNFPIRNFWRLTPYVSAWGGAFQVKFGMNISWICAGFRLKKD